MSEPLEIHLEASKDTSIESLTAEQQKFKYSDILQCLDNGAAWLTKKNKTKRIFNPETIIEAGQTLHIYCNQFTLEPCPYTPLLISDEIDFSVWLKPSGMLSQGSKFGSHWSIHRWIEQHHFKDRECFITHRLDRFTEGLILVAHNKQTNFELHRLFEARQIHKTYRAIVRGLFEIGEIVEINSQINKQDATSVATGLSQETQKNISLVEIEPKTGRKHQVRRHLSYMGHSVINDRQYGETPYTGDLMLQACGLEFNHPISGKEFKFTIPESSILTLESL